MQTPSATLVAILVLAGCAGAQSTPTSGASASSTPSATPGQRPLFVQLTDTGCATTPASMEGVSDGRNTWRLLNQSTSLASFQLMQIEDGSFDKLASFFQGTLVPEPSQPPEGLPFVIREMERVKVESGDEGTLTSNLGSGVHGIACIFLDEHEDIVSVQLIGPFTVPEDA